jgi:predicted nuclease of restriction endonuclease-like (RecB) superfamily
MLKRLMEFGIQEKFFDIKPIGELPKSCCTQSKVDVIDFDQTKEIISKIGGLQQPKSADALKILPELNHIDFIELKGFQQFIKHFDKQSKGHFQPDETIKNQIVDFNLSQKIHDSLFILNSLIHHKDFKRTQSEAAKFKQITKGYLIVVDIELNKDPIKDRLVTLAFLSKGSLEHRIINQLNNSIGEIPASALENLEAPKLVSCKTIDAYYQRAEFQA